MAGSCKSNYVTAHFLISKDQTRITGMDDQVLRCYAKGMSTRDIVTPFKRYLVLKSQRDAYLR